MYYKYLHRLHGLADLLKLYSILYACSNVQFCVEMICNSIIFIRFSQELIPIPYFLKLLHMKVKNYRFKAKRLNNMMGRVYGLDS